jgi:hypothetical protein
MKNIKYTAGFISHFSEDFLIIRLYNGSELVYKANIPVSELDVILTLNKNIVYEAK